MLYDPKWETTTTKPDVFSLESLIAWLEKQPAEKVYCYLDNGQCLLGQYFTSSGFRKVFVGGFELRHAESDGDIMLSEDFSDIAWHSPRTFGAALRRAQRKLRDR